MRALIIMLGLLAVMGLVGKYEYRYAVQDLERSYMTALGDLESAEKTIEDMHQAHNYVVQAYRQDLADLRHELQMPSWYFLEHLAQRLEEGGQCDVVIKTAGRLTDGH